MASFLDATGLAYFTNIFVFLFVWVVIYAILTWTKIIGDNKFIAAAIGLLFGIFVLVSPGSTKLVSDIAPFLGAVFVITFMLNIASTMFGAEVQAFPAVKGLFMIFIVFIIIIGVAINIKDKKTPEQEKEKSNPAKAISIVFNPTFLATILIFSIAVFTIALLAVRSP